MGQLYSVFTRCVALCVILLSLSLTGFANQGKIKVTLEVSNKRRAEVLHLLEKQTGMIFFYASNLFNTEEKITVSAVDQTLDDVLEKVFEGTGMSWQYEREKFISVKPRKNIIVGGGMEKDSTIVSISVTGKVTAADGTPIPGATIRVKRTGDGATSDNSGNFTLPNVRKSDIITISSIGFQTMEIPAARKTLLVKLPIDVNKLDETVVIAYGSSTRRMLTGNVSQVSRKEIESQPVGNILNALQARVPGLSLTQVSGVPGSRVDIQIRGRNSIGNGTNPLFVIDGVPFYSSNTPLLTMDNPNFTVNPGMTTSPLNTLNPSDIESVEILKDADATAIYGSRAANGVILITTRKGKIGKPTVDLRFTTGLGKITRDVPLLNTKQYLEMRREAYKNDGVTNLPASAYDLNGTWDSTRYTDWQKVFIGGTSHYNDAQVSLSGGSEDLQYLMGAGYHKETTVYPGDFFDRRVSFHTSLNHQSPNQKFKTTFSASYSKGEAEMPISDLKQFITLSPNAPEIYDSVGRLNWQNSTWSNPFSNVYQTNESSTEYLLSNLDLSYVLLPGLTIKTAMGYTSSNMDQILLKPMRSLNPLLSTSEASSTFGTNTANIWNIEPQLIYNRKLSKGILNLLFGTTISQQTQKSTAATGSGYANDALLKNINAANMITQNGNTYSLYKYAAAFARINYALEGKYILNLTARRDGSSRFGPGRQFANFGAVGVGWIFSEEKVIKDNIAFLSYGKIRGSYGTTGNDQIGDYQFYSTYSPTNSSYRYLGLSTISPTRLPNTDYAWEVNRKLEVGLELGAVKDRYLLNISYYTNRSSNQLLVLDLPSYTGGTGVTANLPALVKNSGLELEMSAAILKSKNITWTTTLNLSIPRNKLLKYPNLENSVYSNTYTIGNSISSRKILAYNGIDRETGLYTFTDIDKSGGITFPEDIAGVVFTGQDFYGGIINELRYKNWSLMLVLQFVKQDNGANFISSFSTPGTRSNQPIYILDRWQNPGDDAMYQKFTSSNSDATKALNNFKLSVGNYNTASFLRLKNLALSYQIPEYILNNTKVRAARLAVQGQNLVTITKYKGWDPETKSTLPPIAVLTIVGQITF